MALLIVLGLLGLLLISAVGFAVLMRTERSAATNYRHTSSARQILYAALSRAIEDLDTDIGNSLNPSWTTNAFHLNKAQRMVSNPEKVLFSYYDNPAGEEPVFARILTKDVMTYIPALFHKRLNDIWTNHTANVTAPDPDAESSRHPEWVPIKHDGSVVGRYAYAIIDTAGLLDASLVYDAATNRWLGASMREVRLDKDIVTIKDILCVECFRFWRSGPPKCPAHMIGEEGFIGHGRYETIAELAALNTGLERKKLSNFEVFSTYSTTVPAGTAPPINLYGISKESELATNKPAILAAFKASGVPDYGALMEPSGMLSEDVLYYALADYVDDNSVMEGRFDRPCTEKVPMVNSFGINMIYKGAEPQYDIDGNLLGYIHTIDHVPMLNFVDWPADQSRAKDTPFLIRGAIKLINPMANKSGLIPDPESGFDIEVYDYGVSPSGMKIEACLPTTTDSLSSGGWEEFNMIDPFSVKSDVTPLNRAPKLNFKMLVAAEVYNQSGNLCYQFPGGKDINLFQSELPGDDFNQTDLWAELNVSVDFTDKINQPVSIWVECVDPRVAFIFGGFPKGESHWYANTNGHPVLIPLLSDVSGYTPPAVYDRMNSLQLALLQNTNILTQVGLDKTRVDGFRLPEFGGDGKVFDPLVSQFRMHVANAPLQTPGELAYLLFGAWETIRLYEHFPTNMVEHVLDDGTVDRVLDHVKFHKVLDHFEVRYPAAVPKGKVNLNSAHKDVLSLLFLDMPLRSEEPYRPAPWAANDKAVPLVKNSNVPQALGALLVSNLDPFRPINNLSDLAKIFQTNTVSAIRNPVPLIKAPITSSEDPNLGEFEREAVIRNVVNLLTTKQQQFTIILRADAFTTRFGSDRLKDGTVLSSAIAVAQVTRDPIKTKDASGREYNKTTVRMLKILE